MKVIVVIDDKNGLLFNQRRQSQDRIIREKILSIIQGRKLWMNAYSHRQFKDEPVSGRIAEAEDCLDHAGEAEYCFTEGQKLQPYQEKISELILFKWNRRYPADTFLDLDLTDGKWKLTYTEDLIGSSHKKITMEVYEHEK